MAIDALGIGEERIAITIYQVGSDSEAASKLESYDTVYNSWGLNLTERLSQVEISRVLI